VPLEGKPKEELELLAIELGAEDVAEHNGNLDIIQSRRIWKQ